MTDTEVMNHLTTLKNDDSSSNDWWDALNNEEKDSINRGLKDIEEGRFHSHDSARKIYEKYV